MPEVLGDGGVLAAGLEYQHAFGNVSGGREVAMIAQVREEVGEKVGSGSHDSLNHVV